MLGILELTTNYLRYLVGVAIKLMPCNLTKTSFMTRDIIIRNTLKLVIHEKCTGYRWDVCIFGEKATTLTRKRAFLFYLLLFYNNLDWGGSEAPRYVVVYPCITVITHVSPCIDIYLTIILLRRSKCWRIFTEHNIISELNNR